MRDPLALEYQYYPGCCLKESHGKPYEVSIIAIAAALGMKIVEMEDWNCCGASPFPSIDKSTADMLVRRNIDIAKKSPKDVIVACSCCYKVLRSGAAEKVRVRHILDVLANDVGSKKIGESVSVQLKNIEVAPYYGCYIGRPKPSFDDAENPQTMDEIIRALGANVIDYSLKTQCCGGTLMIIDERAAFRLVGNLLRLAKEKEADCIVTPCPLCHFNLDRYQSQISRAFGVEYNIPVLFITQLIGLAFGLSPEEIGLKGIFFEKNFASVRPLLKKIKGETTDVRTTNTKDRRLYLSLWAQYRWASKCRRAG